MPDGTDNPGDSHSLHGFHANASDREALRRGVELAQRYRGDVTVVRRSTGKPVEGYVFRIDLREGKEEEALTMLPKDSEDRLVIPLGDIEAITLSGKDAAAGKSFERWVKRYVQQKLAGRPADIEADAPGGD